MTLVERAFGSVCRTRSDMLDREIAARLLTALMLLPFALAVRILRENAA